MLFYDIIKNINNITNNFNKNQKNTDVKPPTTDF